MLTTRQIRNLFKISPFGIVWGLYGLLYVLIEAGLMGAAKVYPSTGNPYDSTSLMAITLGAFGMGIFLGAIDNSQKESDTSPQPTLTDYQVGEKWVWNKATLS